MSSVTLTASTVPVVATVVRPHFLSDMPTCAPTVVVLGVQPQNVCGSRSSALVIRASAASIVFVQSSGKMMQMLRGTYRDTVATQSAGSEPPSNWTRLQHVRADLRVVDRTAGEHVVVAQHVDPVGVRDSRAEGPRRDQGMPDRDAGRRRSESIGRVRAGEHLAGHLDLDGHAVHRRGQAAQPGALDEQLHH